MERVAFHSLHWNSLTKRNELNKQREEKNKHILYSIIEKRKEGKETVLAWQSTASL